MDIKVRRSKRPLVFWLLSLFTILANTVPALAASWPEMTVMIDNQVANPDSAVSWNFDAAKDTYSLAGPVTWFIADGSSFTLGSAQAVPDPLLLFSASATNNSTNPLTYSFAFNAPLVPNLIGPVNSHAELGVTLTDGLNDGATVQPTLPGGNMLTSFDLYNDGTPISKNVDIGSLFHILSGTSGTNFSKDSSLVCSQACVTMSAILSFTLTANDSVGLSGKVTQVAAVPLPAAAWLFGTGVFALASAARRNSLFGA